MEFTKNVQENKDYCHDCGKELEVENGEIKGGVMAVYETEQGKVSVIKCLDCYNKNKALTNYQSCEVYSRVVGYLRPVSQWNNGKQKEFKDRKEFEPII